MNVIRLSTCRIALVPIATAWALTSFIYAAEETSPAKPEATQPEPVKTEPVQRKPVPGVDAQADMTRRMKDVFKEDYKKKGSDELSAFAKKLLFMAENSTHDPAQHYTTLREAYTIAASVNDYETAFLAVDQLGAAFVLDPQEMKIATLVAANKNTPAPDAQAPIIHAGVALWDAYIAADQYDAALKVATVVDVLAKASRADSYINASANRIKTTREYQVEFAKIKDVTQRAKGNEAEINGALGRFNCLIKGDWTKGLPLLVKCNDEELKTLAAKELAPPANADELLAVAEGWNDFASKQNGLGKSRGLAHAQGFYSKAMPDLTGLTRAKAEKRLEALQQARGVTTINMLPATNSSRDAVAGKWKTENGALVSDSTAMARIMFPYLVPEEYDFHLDVIRATGGTSMAMILDKDGHEFVFEFAFTGDMVGFVYVNGQHVAANPTGVKYPMPNGKRYNLLVQVRNHALRVFVDGKQIISFATDYKNVTPHADWSLGEKRRVGFGSNGNPAMVLAAELIEVSGKAKLSPHVKD